MVDGAGAVAVDGVALGAARAALEELAADLAAVAARATALAPAVLGARRLVVEVERAQADQALHVEALRRLADVAAEDLGAAAVAYARCEADVVAALTPRAYGPPVPLPVATAFLPGAVPGAPPGAGPGVVLGPPSPSAAGDADGPS